MELIAEAQAIYCFFFLYILLSTFSNYTTQKDDRSLLDYNFLDIARQTKNKIHYDCVRMEQSRRSLFIRE